MRRTAPKTGLEHEHGPGVDDYIKDDLRKSPNSSAFQYTAECIRGVGEAGQGVVRKRRASNGTRGLHRRGDEPGTWRAILDSMLGPRT